MPVQPKRNHNIFFIFIWFWKTRHKRKTDSFPSAPHRPTWHMVCLWFRTSAIWSRTARSGLYTCSKAFSSAGRLPAFTLEQRVAAQYSSQDSAASKVRPYVFPLRTKPASRSAPFFSKLFSRICTELDCHDLSTDNAEAPPGTMAVQHPKNIHHFNFVFCQIHSLTSFCLTSTLYSNLCDRVKSFLESRGNYFQNLVNFPGA